MDILDKIRIIAPAYELGYGSSGTMQPSRAVVQAHRDIEQEIVSKAGGFTRTTGVGAWVDDDGEMHKGPVYIYDIAVPVSGGHALAHELSLYVKRALDQQCVYLRDVDFVVHFV